VTRGVEVVDELSSHADNAGDGGSDRPLYIFAVRVS
jgi:hypothetical protein